MKATSYFEKSKSIALTYYFPELIIKSCLSLSAAYFNLNFTSKAISELNRVLDFKPSEFITGKVYHNLAASHSVSIFFLEAIKYGEKAKAIYKKLKLSTEIVEVELIIGGCYSNLGNFKKVKKLLYR